MSERAKSERAKIERAKIERVIGITEPKRPAISLYIAAEGSTLLQNIYFE